MIRLFICALLLLIAGITTQLFAQNYTTVANGNWSSASVWNNTSGWGGTTPSLGGQGSGLITVNHDITTSGNYTTGSATLNVNAGKTLTINGDLSIGGGGTINVSGTLIITGNANLSSNLNILPGGAVYVLSTLTVTNSQNLRVGTTTAPPPYADLIVMGDLVSTNSGDILVNRNGRMAVSGNLTGSGGGTLLTIANGGQAYVGGNIQFTGGGSAINNSNTTSPFGLYVDGTITNTGGGSTTTGNTADVATLQATNPSFYSWVGTVIGPLPVELLFFKTLVQDHAVLLTWATAIERNADYFVLEKSTNGHLFVPIDTIASSGNSTIRKNYSTIDNYPLIGKNYYRLKHVDFDGYYEYFEVAVADYKTVKKIVLYPTLVERDNPVTIQFNFTSEKKLPIRIYDSQGILVDSFELEGPVLEYYPQLTSGTYFIKAKSLNDDFVQRFFIR